MKTIFKRQIPAGIDEFELRNALQRYVDALEAHAATVGQPAPFPEYEILRGLTGGFIVIDDDEEQPEEPWTVETIAARKNDEINKARAAANTSTFPWQDKMIACDALSRSDIDGIANYIALFGELPSNFPGAWKATDNTFIPITTAEAFKDMFNAMVAQGAANFIKSETLKGQMAAIVASEELTDEQKIAAIQGIEW